MAVMVYENGALAFALFQFLAWAFAFVATPTAQFQTAGHGCYTMWGYRDYCGRVAYNTTGVAAFGCQARASTMTSAAAFGVISTTLTFVTFILAILMNSRFQAKVPVVLVFGLSSASIATTLVSWACVAAVKVLPMCGAKFQYGYTAGFALMVASWGMEIIATVFLFLFASGERIDEVHSDLESSDEEFEPKRQQPIEG
ncbi:amastin-like surface protein-like protein [Strigomonas culicis]|uniref:Amastin-like surface protein-like protein n=1 Tax=Strigomonas culicis TaxID=28005 RepID=S9VVX7_9TRYP|nr:amastin-like surface protein-like protein [Strigomonas culicis]EPY31141.1 amastin-like surface protein-like protein [Strigomonas culicis]|eukprot:EPY28402.1 amastin-like surface protein-like protein [Strigomonas culicis]